MNIHKDGEVVAAGMPIKPFVNGAYLGTSYILKSHSLDKTSSRTESTLGRNIPGPSEMVAQPRSIGGTITALKTMPELDIGALFQYPIDSVPSAASVTLDGDLTITTKEKGKYGNDRSFSIIAGAEDLSIVPSSDGLHLTINIDEGVTTWAEVKAALEAEVLFSEYFTAAYVGPEDGTGTPAAVAQTYLTGGASNQYELTQVTESGSENSTVEWSITSRERVYPVNLPA